MKLLLDAHIAPSLAAWIKEEFGIECYSFDFLEWRTLSDLDAFQKARELNATILSKDNDFITLQEKLKSPPKIIWLTCGNTSKESLKGIF
jgi:predicted nuclease of predicted toxin-antitoxin system